MATKSTNKTLWTVALVAVFGFAVWKLLPVLARKLNGGGGGGGGSVGSGGSGLPYYPQNPYDSGQQGSQNPLANLSFGNGLGKGSSGSNLSDYGSGTGLSAADTIAALTYADGDLTGPGSIPFAGDGNYGEDTGDLIPTVPLTNSGGFLSSFQDWFSGYFLGDTSGPTTGVGATSADLQQYQAIQTESVDLGTLDTSSGSDLTSYDTSSGSGADAPVDYADSSGDGGGDGSGDYGSGDGGDGGGGTPTYDNGY